MSVARYSACVISAGFIAACGTPESNAWLGGIPRQEALEAASAVRQQTSAQILSFERDRDDHTVIDVWVRGHDQFPELYKAKRVGKHLKVDHRILVW